MANRYFIELSFKGTNFHGWQVQDNAHSVQAELNGALETLLSVKTETLGAGRTDTGVHAKQFFAQFDFEGKIPEILVHQLNGILPAGISVKRIFQVKPDTSARFDAVSRTYEYWIYRNKNPFLKEYAWFFPYDTDLAIMNAASEILRGYNDFKCFSKSNTQVKTTICKIFSAGWKVSREKDFGEKLVFEITANRFLRNMVRAIVGTILQIGKGEISPDEFRKIIEGGNRSEAGFSVPACGLYLTGVEYDWNKIIL